MKLIKTVRKVKKVDRAAIFDLLTKSALYIGWAVDREVKGKSFTTDEKKEINQRILKIEEDLRIIKTEIK